MARGLGRAAGAATVVLLLGFMTIPTVVVIVASFNATATLSFPPDGLSLAWYKRALSYPDFRAALRNSLLVTAVASATATIVGGAAAIALDRAPVPGKGIISGLLLSPLVVPGVVIGLGFLILAARLELVTNPIVMILAHAVTVVPFVLRSVWVSLQSFDPAVERAAAVLGASPTQVILRVTLPLLRPGFFAALLFCVIISFNEFVASLFISTRVTEILPVAMYNYVRNYTDPTIAAVSTLFILATAALLFLLDRAVNVSSILQIEEGR
jgi:putative spermidine/putrescine transport system permease protein